MASIPSNSISQSPPATNPRAPEKPKEGYWKIVGDVGGAISQTLKCSMHIANIGLKQLKVLKMS